MTDGTNPVIDLKPCPFCGDDEELRVEADKACACPCYWWVVCGACSCRVAAESREGAIAAWNTRAAPPANPVIVERVLPCDVHLPPATTILKGCKLETLIEALEARGMTQAALEAMPDVVGLREALEPFATFGADQVDDEGWNDTGLSTKEERIVDWFGPSDFRRALAALAKVSGESAPLPDSPPRS